jgi:DNA-directed RNA polymerase specialized sigma24 family protein
MGFEETGAQFETTRWTLMQELQDGTPERKQAAKQLLAARYWPAVYSWLRRRGHGRDEAAELTQDFFTEIVLGRDLLERTDPQRGRLRTFMLSSLRRFLIDRHRRESRRNSHSRVSLADLQQEDKIAGLVKADHADDLFDRRWALAMLDEALQRCEQHFTDVNRTMHWQAFALRVVIPARNSSESPPLDEVARVVGFASAADAGAAIQVVKRRVKMFLRELVAETANSPADQDDEFRHLLMLLKG